MTKSQYDGLNRRIFAGFGWNGSSYESTITDGYDGGNRLTSAVDSTAGTITRQYDGLDNPQQEVTPLGTANYQYDSASRRSTIQVVGQSQVSYNFDNANRLNGITQGSQSVGLNYDNANRRTCLSLPSGVTESYGYDNDSRIISITYGSGGTCSSPPSNLGNLTYTYDAAGRRLSMGGSLAAVTLPANVAGGSSTTYNADNEQVSFNGTTQTFDANGNLTNDGTNTYSWDSRNHLTGISGGSTASFVYDGVGRRQEKVINSATTQFVYDGLNPLQELDGASTPNVTANLLTGLAIGEYYTRSDSTNNLSTFLRDDSGSTVGLVGSPGTIATSYIYQPSGATSTSGASSGNLLQFRGRENDAGTLYYYNARYYSPTNSVLLNSSPSGFQDLQATSTMVQPVEDLCSANPLMCTVIVDALGAAVRYVPPVAAGVAIGLGAAKLCNKLRQGCPPCNPPVGTECYEPNYGHTHNGWDPHYHMWSRGQGSDCVCHWNKWNGTKGATQTPKDGIQECSTYASWPNN